MGCGSSSAERIVEHNLKENPKLLSTKNQVVAVPKVVEPNSKKQIGTYKSMEQTQHNHEVPDNDNANHFTEDYYNPLSVNISDERLAEYVDLEKSIHNMEKQKILQKLHVAVDQIQQTTTEITNLEEKLHRLEAKIKSENFDAHPEITSKELITEIDNIGKTENDNTKEKNVGDPATDDIKKQKAAIESELNQKRNKCEQLEIELADLNTKAVDLLHMYLRQDELLVVIFSECHGNEKEEKLSSNLQELEDKKRRVELARNKWKEAQLLLEYACKQLAVAVKEWQNLPNVPSINLEVRYSLTKEIQKCLEESGRALPSGEEWGQLPQCSPEELAALEAMATNSKPGALDANHLMTLENYSDAHKKAVATLNWFNRVLSASIHRDLVDVCEDVRFTSQALRQERIKLVKEQLKKKYGKSFNIDNEDFAEDVIQKLLAGSKGDRRNSLVELQNLWQANQTFKSSGKINGVKAPAPVAVIPPKKKMQLPVTINLQKADGTIEDMKIEQKQNTNKFNQDMEVNRARVEKQLGQQLSARRDIRAKKSSPTREDKG